MSSFLALARRGSRYFIAATSNSQAAFLLLVRLYWGWLFFLAGKGKLGRIEQVSGFFSELGIPLPTLNAYFIGTLECVGGGLLMAGLAARLVSLPLTVTLLVAFATADREALMSIVSDSDKFLAAAPLTFLLATLPILVFGPGRFSLDYLIERLAGTDSTVSPGTESTPGN